MNKKYMERALELAEKGVGRVNPNPLVGAVIVKEDRILSEGWHEQFGGPHAEVNAFNRASEDVSGATLYVTLEPCSHYGKTPPCAEAIIQKKISKVVIGMIDPNPLVAGKGVELLRKSGIEVISGVLESECRKQNEIFIKYIQSQLPFVILKSAMTLDGKIATSTGDSKWITGESSRKHVHELRNRVSGIMVGIGTVLQDNPHLTTRLESTSVSHPIRIVVDSMGRTPLDSNVLQNLDICKTIIAVTDRVSSAQISIFKDKGAEVLVIESLEGRVNLKALFEKLGALKIDSILLEGGSELNFSALKAGMVDKIMMYIAPKLIGGSTAKTPVGGAGVMFMSDAMALNHFTVTKIDEDLLIEGYF